MNSVKIKIKTPIWTGDIDSKSNSLQPTGIMGSIRWWAEAILRAMGKFACDPVEDSRCPKEKKDGERKINQYCHACLIFGATGIRRGFRVEMENGKPVFIGRALNIKPSKRKGGWYMGSGITGKINLSIIPLNKDFDNSLVFVPLVLASKWGGIGARTQHGYGIVEIEDCPDIDFNEFNEAVEKITIQERLSKLKINLRDENSKGLPNLREMFLAKVQFEVTDNDWWKKVDGIAPRSQDNYRGYINDQRMIDWVNSASVPIAPAIKNWLRYKYGLIRDRRISNWLFGTTRSERIASKINISCAYKIKDILWEFRIWGWIPRNGPNGFDRDKFLKSLRQAFSESGSVTIPWNNLLGNQTKDHKLMVWREFNSSRDTVKPGESNIGNYLQSLLRGEE